MRASTSVESAVLLRWASQELKDVLKSQRIASVVGPRQCGKTTLVESCGLENSVYYSLDLESNLQAALQDPGFLISQYRSRCLILDEIQKAPILIGEIKYAVDHDHRCGQFVLTGSSDYRRLPHAQKICCIRSAYGRLSQDFSATGSTNSGTVVPFLPGATGHSRHEGAVVDSSRRYSRATVSLSCGKFKQIVQCERNGKAVGRKLADAESICRCAQGHVRG